VDKIGRWIASPTESNGHISPKNAMQSRLEFISTDPIEQNVKLYFSELGRDQELKPDDTKVAFQKKEIHRNYLLARTSYEVEGLSQYKPNLNHIASDNIENQIYSALNERFGEVINDSDNGEKEVKKTAIWILAITALNNGIEYRNFDNFGLVQYSLGLERNNFDFEAHGFRATNNNINNALHDILKGGYVAQGQTGNGKPILVTTSNLDLYLK
jgi:hypothetical protein